MGLLLDSAANPTTTALVLPESIHYLLQAASLNRADCTIWVLVHVNSDWTCSTNWKDIKDLTSLSWMCFRKRLGRKHCEKEE